jgi:hypothetical protein
MTMYSFIPLFREVKLCVVPSCGFDKLGCATGDKRLQNTDVKNIFGTFMYFSQYTFPVVLISWQQLEF